MITWQRKKQNLSAPTLLPFSITENYHQIRKARTYTAKRVLGGFFWLRHMAYRVLVPQPGIKPGPSAVAAQSTTGLQVIPLVFYNEVPGASSQDPTRDKVMRRRPDKQGRSGLQGFRKAAPAPTLKMISVFLMLAVLDYSLISVTRGERLPWSLSQQNQLRTLITMSPGRWYPIRLPRMKGVFQFRPLCWHSSLVGKCVLIHMTAHSTLIISSIKNLITQKALIGTEPLGWGGEEAILEDIKYYSKSGYS